MRRDIGSSQSNNRSSASDRRSNLTTTQREVLDCIVTYFEEYDAVPEVSAILQLTGRKSRTNLYRILRELAEKGWLDLGSHGSGVRLHYRLTERARLKGKNAWPLLGVIPAGPVRDVGQMEHDVISSLSDIIPDMERSDRVIRVTGDWMKEKGIHAGDFVVISPLQEYMPRDICAVRRTGSSEIILAFVHPLRSGLLLTFADADYKSRNYPVDEVTVLGVVTSHISLTSFMP